MEETALEEQALEEILKDIKRGAERAKEHGALGWQKNPAPPTNKRFLRNMLASTLRDDRPFTSKRRPQKDGRRPPEKPPDPDPDPDLVQRKNSDTRFRYGEKHPALENNDSDELELIRRQLLLEAQSSGEQSTSRSGRDGCDAKGNRLNGRDKDRKKKSRKRHHKSEDDADDSPHRSKHKKSKKSKRHKSKKSRQSSSHRP